MRQQTSDEFGRTRIVREMGGESLGGLLVPQAIDQVMRDERIGLGPRRQDGRARNSLAKLPVHCITPPIKPTGGQQGSPALSRREALLPRLFPQAWAELPATA